MLGRDGADDPSAERYSVTPEYFTAMGIPLIRGRGFSNADTATSDAVIVISDKTAAELFPGREAMGARVRVGDALNGPWRTIVGIAGSVRHQSMASVPAYQMYLPQTQFTDSGLTFVVRTSGEPGELASEARRAIRAAIPDAPIENITTLDALVAKSVGPRRFVMVLLTLFGVVALSLTSVGVYGVIACSVAERTREIGIRGALGASRLDVVRLVLGGGFATIAVGVVAGLGGTFAGVRLLQASLYGVSPHDATTMAGVVGLLLVTALLAHAVPLARALRVEPTVALREE
jgi:putative ABC transport system permease protein